jgi:hypothetical protein
MRSRLLLLSLALLLVPAVVAENTPTPLSTAEQARQFEQNLPLLQTLVESSLRLADDDDPFQRAQDCAFLADKLAAALGEALDRSDAARSDELATHLHAVVNQGLAVNLRAAREHVPPGSTPDREMQALVERLVQRLAPLEQRLEAKDRAHDAPLLLQSLRLLREAQGAMQ